GRPIIQKRWTSPRSLTDSVSRKTDSFTEQRKNIEPVIEPLNACVFMKRSRMESGHTTVYSISLTRGANATSFAACSSFAWLVEGDEDLSRPALEEIEHRRLIPTWVKLEVWKRDGGKCVRCGSADNLHFDHDLPFSKGGTSISTANVQLLCARHNLAKR